MIATIFNLMQLQQPAVLDESIKPLSISLQDSPMGHLLLLPRVGVKTSLKIMSFRKQHAIQSPHDLMDIKGIGTATVNGMLPYLQGASE